MRDDDEDQSLEPDADSMIPTMQVGQAHMKWMVSFYRPDPRVKSWQIAMEFDQYGELTSYWEGSLDEYGERLTGGGIERC